MFIPINLPIIRLSPSRILTVLLLLSMVLLAWAYGYFSIFELPPMSTHSWRQTDSATLALNYYHDGLSFFQPRIHNLLRGEGHTLGEFPLLYYLAAIGYHLFGVEDGWFRLLNFAILAAGVWALGRIYLELSKTLWLAWLAPLLLLTSPVLAFYGFNFLPDTAALGFSWLSWWFLYRFFKEEKKGDLLIGSTFLTLAILTKATCIISLAVIAALFIFHKKSGFHSIFLRNKKRIMISAVSCIAAVGLFYAWMAHFKNVHESTYFLAGIKPIWEMDGDRIYRTGRRIFTKWSWAYFHPLTHLFFTGSLFYFLFSKHRLTRQLIGWTTVGVSAILLAWFYQFHHHDYYFIVLLVLPAVLLGGWARLFGEKPNWRSAKWIFAVVSAFLIFNIYHAKKEMDFRYRPGNKYLAGVNLSLFKTKELRTFLRTNGVDHNSRILSLPDRSPNTTLYYYDCPGWTEFNAVEKIVPHCIDGKYSAESIRYLINQGCEYLIINKGIWLQRPELKPFLRQPVDTFENSIYLYRLGSD